MAGPNSIGELKDVRRIPAIKGDGAAFVGKFNDEFYLGLQDGPPMRLADLNPPVTDGPYTVKSGSGQSVTVEGKAIREAAEQV